MPPPATPVAASSSLQNPKSTHRPKTPQASLRERGAIVDRRSSSSRSPVPVNEADKGETPMFLSINGAQADTEGFYESVDDEDPRTDDTADRGDLVRDLNAPQWYVFDPSH